MPGARLVAFVSFMALAWAGPCLAACPGDCDGDLEVSEADLQAALQAALSPSLPDCALLDAVPDGQVTVTDLVRLIGLRSRSCSGFVPSTTCLLEATPVVGQGGVASLTWTLPQPAPGARLELRLQAPGAAIDLEFPGTRPPTGTTWWLKSTRDGWTSSPVALAAPATSGSVSLPLPSSARGAWRALVLVVDDATQGVLQLCERTLLASDGPAVLVESSREVAGPGDRVRARLLATSGPAPSAARLSACAVRPDGSQIALPSGEPGTLSSEEIDGAFEATLFDGVLADWGLGTWRFEARLHDGAGRPLALGSVSVLACDGVATVTGTVFDAHGTPLPGPAGVVVSAFDVDELALVGEAAIDASGHHSLTAPAGTWLVSAGGPSRLVRAACGEVASVDLQAGATAAPALAGVTPGAASPASPACDPGLPPPRLLAMFLTNAEWLSAVESIELGPLVARGLLEVFTDALRQAAPDVTVTSVLEIEQALNQMAATMNDGGDDGTHDPSQLGGQGFTVSLVLEQHASLQQRVAKAIVSRAYDGSIVTQASRTMGSSQEVTESLVESIAAEVGQDLRCQLLASVERPVSPRVRLEVDPKDVAQFHSTQVRVTLADADGLVQPNRDVSFRVTPCSAGVGAMDPCPSGWSDVTGQGETDFFGVLSRNLSLAVGLHRVTGRFDRGTEGWTSPPEFVRVHPAGTALRVETSRVMLRVGEPDQACAIVNQGGAPAAGVAVAFEATSGSLGAAQASTDSEGRACVTYTAPSDEGIVTLAALLEQGAGPPPVGHALDPAPRTDPAGSWTSRPRSQALLTAETLLVVDSGLTVTVNAADVAAGGLSEVRVSVAAAAGNLEGLPVSLALEGAGSLSSLTATTDAAGEAVVYFRAPAGQTGTTTVRATVTLAGATASGSDEIVYQLPAWEVRILGPSHGSTCTIDDQVDSLPTYVEAFTYDENAPPHYCADPRTTTLAGTFVGAISCGLGSWPPLGSVADLPVTLAAASGGDHASVTLAHVQPLAVELSHDVAGIGRAHLQVELVFHRAGTLQVLADQAWNGGDYEINYCRQWAETHLGSFAGTYEEVIPIAQPQSVVLSMNLPTWTPASGRLVTFTFTPD